MQDNAHCHNAAHTKREIRARGIKVINGPPFSPDLHPLENVWNWMKDYIQKQKKNYPRKLSRAQLEEAVIQAWNAVSEDFLDNLIKGMERRINFGTDV